MGNKKQEKAVIGNKVQTATHGEVALGCSDGTIASLERISLLAAVTVDR